MSDTELRERLNRLQMEKQYAQILKENAAAAKGKSFAQKTFKVMKTTADVTETVIKLYNNAAKIKKILSEKTS